MSEKTVGQEMLDKLSYKRKNIYESATPEKIEKIFRAGGMMDIEWIQLYGKEIHYRYGKVLLDKKSLVLEQFLRNGKASYEKIIADISNSESEKTKERCKELQEELVFIKEALREYV